MRKSLCLLIVCLMYTSAWATPVPVVQIMWSGDNNPGSWTSTYSESDVNSNGGTTYGLSDTWSNGVCEGWWDLTIDEDPFVIAAIGFTNTLATTQTFTLIFTSPVNPLITPTSLHGGSTGGSLTDNATIAGLATVATVNPSPFYAGRIDGSTVMTLYDDPNSWTAPFEGGTANIPAISKGLPGPFLPSGPALNTISIMHKFSLTPGDAVSLTSQLLVTPEPTTIMLLGLGGLALLRKRRA